MEDLKKLKAKNWTEIGKDRRTWRDLAEKVKTQKRVVMPNDDDDDVYNSEHCSQSQHNNSHTINKI
jgi:hypothetical protein